MTEQPQFVDNRDGNTLARAINEYLDYLDGRLIDEPDLDVVTGYFNPRGYFSVADGLEHVDQVRLGDDSDRLAVRQHHQRANVGGRQLPGGRPEPRLGGRRQDLAGHAVPDGEWNEHVGRIVASGYVATDEEWGSS